jgi:hypothetical protein
LGLAEEHSSKQHAELPSKLPQPSQAAGSASPLTLLKDLSRTSLAAECRICLSAATKDQEMIQPCACAGSMAFIHTACLTAWVQEKGSLTCELCKQQ